VLPAPLSPAQGERVRGDAEGGREPAGARRGGLRDGQVLGAATQGLGSGRETADVEGRQGKSAVFGFFLFLIRRRPIDDEDVTICLRLCLLYTQSVAYRIRFIPAASFVVRLGTQE